jgi:hypothetical protein
LEKSIKKIQNIKIRNAVIIKIGVTQTVKERMENRMLK